MDPNWQGGGDPNGRGAYYNYNRASRGRPTWMQEGQAAMALPLLTSFPQFQPHGGYRYNFAPSAAPTTGHASHQFSEVVSLWQQHPDSATVVSAPGNISGGVIPHAPVYPPGAAGVYAQQPGSAAVFNTHGYNSNPPLASVYQPGAPLYGYAQPHTATDFSAWLASVFQPGAPLHGYAQPRTATDFSAWGGNANNGAYTSASAGLVAPHADDGGASRGLMPGDPRRSRLALQNFKASVLQGAVQRASTLCDLEWIVSGVVWANYHGVPLMEVAEPSSGEQALKDLVWLALQHLGPGALEQLFRCLVHGWIMEQSKGPELLRHFFTTLPYDHCSIFIDELAVPRFYEMVTSNFGQTSMMVCLDNAQYIGRGAALHDIFVSQTIQIARNAHGSALLRSIFQYGRNHQLRERIRRRVEANLVELFRGQFGIHVVLACFLPRVRRPLRSVTLLQRGLQAFRRRLSGVQFRELVQNRDAIYVLDQLLSTSVECNVARAEAKQLARRILGVRAAGGELSSIARRVINNWP